MKKKKRLCQLIAWLLQHDVGADVIRPNKATPPDISDAVSGRVPQLGRPVLHIITEARRGVFCSIFIKSVCKWRTHLPVITSLTRLKRFHDFCF